MRDGGWPGAAPAAGREAALSVSALVRQAKQVLEGRWPTVWVEGEVSGFRPHSSGHWYFTLKDAQAQVAAVMFRGANTRVRFPLKDGDVVLARGRVTLYEPSGKFQLVLDDLEPRGLGALQAAFEALKRRLESEGLFDEARKRPLPFLPRRIGLVTSPTGAAVRDMLRILGERDPGLAVTIAPARVQGDGAAREIADALDLLGRDGRVDVILCGRGGGRIEDLWPFNEEVVARAIARCRVPVISCVGHEVDFTIADFVADRSAPTPTAAAEMAVRRRDDLLAGIADLRDRLEGAQARSLARRRVEVVRLQGRLVSPGRRLEIGMQRLDELRERLARATRAGISRRRTRVDAAGRQLLLVSPARRVSLHRVRLLALGRRLDGAARVPVRAGRARLEAFAAALHALSPLAVLGRGYALAFRVRDTGPRLLRDAAEVTPGDPLRVQLSRGTVEATVTAVRD